MTAREDAENGHLLADLRLFVPDAAPVIGRFTADDDYDVFDVFEGGMAEVYLCAPRIGPRLAYAFKSPKQDSLLDPVIQRAFRRECSIAVHFAGISGILPVYGIVEHDGRPFLKMQGVLPDKHNTVSLRDVIERGPVPPAVVGYYLAHLTLAMCLAADRLPGLVHGDLKPENILMLLGVPHISDFGLATVHRTADSKTLRAGDEYLCPEAKAGAAPAAAWDVYSFGVLLAELLTGLRPGPQASASLQEDDATGRLLAVSGACRAADPADRPDMRELHRLVLQAAPGGDWPIPESARRAYEYPAFMFLGAAAMDWDGVLTSLLRNQDYEGVLQQVDRRPASHRTWRDLLHRGTALSLLDRDEEALASYDEAEAVLGPGQPQHLDRINLERAASLKRLGRYEEAAELLHRLVSYSTDAELRTTARLNLGALLVESGRFDQARRVLHQALMRVGGPQAPGILYTGYVNLAAAERAGNPEAAVTALRQAVALRPSDNAARRILADVLLSDLDRAAEAAAVLDGVIGAGSTELGILRMRLACAVLMSDREAVDRVRALLRERDSNDDLDGRMTDAFMDAAVHCRRFGRPDLVLEQYLPADLRAAVPSYAASWPENPPGTNDHAVASPDAPAAPEAGSRPEQAGSISAAILHWDDPDLRPHLRSDGAIGFDLTVAFDEPDAVSRIAAAYQSVASEVSLQTGTTMTGSPVLLVRCPACSSEMATTRPPGSPLGCRCGTPGKVTPATGARLTEMRAELAARLYPDGEKPLEGWAVIVLVQLPGRLALRAARWLDQLIEGHQLERLDDRHPARLYIATMQQAWDLFLSNPPMALRWRYPAGARGSSHVTPVPVQAFLNEFRSVFDSYLNTMSYSYDTTVRDFECLVLEGQVAEAAVWLERRPAEREDADRWILLASIASVAQDLAAVERYVLTAITADSDHPEAWHLYAGLLLRSGRAEEAAEAAERACQLQPAVGESWVFLARCRYENGDHAGAAGAFTRAIALGADPDQVPSVLTGRIDFGHLAQTLASAMIGDAEARTVMQQLIVGVSDLENGAATASALRRLLAGEPEDAVLSDLSGGAELIVTILLTEMRAARPRTGGSTANPADDADVLEHFGLVRMRQGQAEEACDLLRRALALRDSAGDQQAKALTANNLAIVLLQAGQLDEAEELLQQYLTYQKDAKDRHREANCLHNLGDVYREKGQAQKAAQSHSRAAQIYEELGDQEDMANALGSLGVDLRILEDYAEARTAYNQALDVYTATGNLPESGRVLSNLARLELICQNWTAAAESSDRAASIFRKLENRQMETSALNISLQANLMDKRQQPTMLAYQRLKELGLRDPDSET